MERIDRIFQISDRNGDGLLDEEEFAGLVRSLNAEVGLNNAQLELIQEEVWSTFPAHIAINGLTLEGLKQIYLEGYADLDRDYDALIKARHGQAEGGNAGIASHPVGLHALNKHSDGGDSSPLSPTPAPASPDIYSTLATPAQGGASTEDELDIFSAVQTPAPTADYSNNLAFAVRLPGVASEAEFEAGATRRNLLAALKDALPEGTATRIVSANPTPLGLAVGVVCCLPEGTMGGEEEEYFTAVLAAEPEQIFPNSTFGHVEVLSADANAASGGTTAAECAAEALAAATRAGAPGQVPLAFSVRLSDVSPTEFKDSKGGHFMAQVWSALPVGSAARVVDVSPANGGCVVTVAAAVPVARAPQATQFIRRVRDTPGAVFDPKELGPAALVTAHQPKVSRPTITVKVRLPGQCAGDVTAPADVATALGRALPNGSSAVVCSIEDSPRGTSAVMTLSAALPMGTDAKGVERAVDTVCASQGWVPADTTAPGDGPAECMRVGSVLDSAFNGEGDGLHDLHFGVAAAKSPKAATIKSPKAKTPKTPKSPAMTDTESLSPKKSLRSPSFISRLFGRSASKKNAQQAPEPVPEASPASPNSPPSPAINGLLNGNGQAILQPDGSSARTSSEIGADDAAIAMSGVIAERRAGHRGGVVDVVDASDGSFSRRASSATGSPGALTPSGPGLVREYSYGSTNKETSLRAQHSVGPRGVPLPLLERNNSDANSMSAGSQVEALREKSSSSMRRDRELLKSHSIKPATSPSGRPDGSRDNSPGLQRRVSDASSMSSGAALAAAAAAADAAFVQREHSTSSVRRESSFQSPSVQRSGNSVRSVQSNGASRSLERVNSYASSYSSGEGLAAASAAVEKALISRGSQSSFTRQDSSLRSHSVISNASARSDASRGDLPSPPPPQQQRLPASDAESQSMSPTSEVAALRERSNASLRSNSSRGSKLRRSNSDPSLRDSLAASPVASPVARQFSPLASPMLARQASPVASGSMENGNGVNGTAAAAAAAAVGATAAAVVARNSSGGRAYEVGESSSSSRGSADGNEAMTIGDGGDGSIPKEVGSSAEHDVPAAVISVTAYPAPGDVQDVDAEQDEADDDKSSVYSDAVSSVEKSPRKGGWLTRMTSKMSTKKGKEGGAGGRPAAPMSEPPSPPTSVQGAAQEAGETSMRVAAPTHALSEVGDNEAPRPSPFEIQRRISQKESAVLNTQAKQLVNKLQFLMDQNSKGKAVEAEVSSIQDTASMLPTAARYAAHMDIGEKLAQRQMFGAAARSFREAAAANPDDALARFRLGNAHFAQHDFMEASRAYFDAMRRADPEDPLLVKIHINMGISLESESRLEAAEREYAKAAEVAPNHPRVHKLLGSARLAMGDAPKAAAALERALQINPEFADAWADMGCAQAALGSAFQSRRCLDKALALEPDHIEAHFNYGNLERQEGNLKAALKHYDHVLATEPEHWRAWLNKAVVLAKVGSTSPRKYEVAACLDRALELSGHGGALEAEIDTLHELLARGASLDILAQQVSAIEERAKIVATRAARDGSLTAALSAAPSGVTGMRSGSFVAGRGGLSPQQMREQYYPPQNQHDQLQHTLSGGAHTPISRTASMKSVSIAGDRPGERSDPHLARSISAQSNSPSKSATSSPDRVLSWAAPPSVAPPDLDVELMALRLTEMGVEAGNALETMDLALLQALVPATTVKLEEIWAEAVESEDMFFGRYGSRTSPLRSRSGRGAALMAGGKKGKMVPLATAEVIARRLVCARCTPYQAKLAMHAIQTQVLALMDFAGTGRVDLAMLLCLIASLVEAPNRERLDLCYRLLMWRTREERGGQQDPVTRLDLVEFLATLKMVFDAQHKTSYLANMANRRGLRGGRATDAQFVMYERFAYEVQRMFMEFATLPYVCIATRLDE